MNPEEQTIAAFYEAFGRHDYEGMARCYHRDVVFTDPAFGQLRGDQARAMWQMLCRAGKDLQVHASELHVSDGRGRAHWDADYTFATKRKIHNSVDAEFDFADGLIIRHTDTFDFGRWTSQAFGPPGWAIGKIPVLPQIVMQQAARAQLRRFQASH